jgi:hypothetical protein
MGLKTAVFVVDKILGTTVAEDGRDPKKRFPIGESDTAMMSIAIGLCVAFVIMTASALACDFSTEEIGIVRHIIGNPLSNMFVGSTHAEIHPLYHALLWYWMNLFRGSNEAFLRLPNMLLMLGTAYVAYTSAKRLFRAPGMAWILIGLILMSPVSVDNYVWAFGYALTVFLATLATAGALFAASGKRLTGVLFLTPSLILLQLVIPATITVGISLVLFLLLHFAVQRKLKLNLLYVLLVLFIVAAGFVGQKYAFGAFGPKKAVVEAVQSYGSNVGLWLLAVLAQVGTFIAISMVARRQKDLPPDDAEDRPAATNSMMRSLPALTVIAAVVGAVAIGVFAVKPMNCVALLVPISFGAIGWYSHRINRINKYFYVMMLVVFGNSLVVTRVSQYLTAKDMANGRYAKNLLQRYDARSQAASLAVETMVRSKVPKQCRIFVQPELFKQFSFYWRIMGGDLEQLESAEKNIDLVLEEDHYRYFPIFAVGHNVPLLRERLKRALGTIILQPMPSLPNIRIMQVIMPPPESDPLGDDGRPTTPIALESRP